MKQPVKKINIHHILPLSEVNGPGKRSILWVQGCHFHCKGCFNQDLHPFHPRELMSPESVFSKLPLSKIEGVTISGGEPFCQAQSLALLAQIIKDAGLTLMVFTGYTYEALLQSGAVFVKRLLEYIDILVDGPYMENYPPNTIWAGSGNQKIHFLTPLDAYYRDKIEKNYQCGEFHITADGEVKATGFTH